MKERPGGWGADVVRELVGRPEAEGMLTVHHSPEGGIVAEVLVSVPGASIAGGTDEVRHNIIGDRVLRLPKEPSVDADVPFREVNVNHRRARENR